MLTLRKDQCDIIMELTNNIYISRMIDIFREMYPKETSEIPPDELRLKIFNGANKALQYGLSLDEHIIEFIGLIFLWGDDFDASEKFPWAAAILSWKDTSPEAKIRALISKSELEIDRQ